MDNIQVILTNNYISANYPPTKITDYKNIFKFSNNPIMSDFAALNNVKSYYNLPHLRTINGGGAL